jgi:hypothetical protein
MSLAGSSEKRMTTPNAGDVIPTSRPATHPNATPVPASFGIAPSAHRPSAIPTNTDGKMSPPR